MNLIIQRLIRQGLTAAAGFLVSKGVLVAGATESWATAGTEFISALVLAGIAFAWSSINARFLQKKAS